MAVASAVPAGAVSLQQQQQLRPFRYSTRQRYRPVSTVTLNPGNTTAPPVDIKQVGFLNALDLTMRDGGAGSGLTLGAALPTLQTFQVSYPFSWVKRLQVALNTGAALLVDVDGRGLDRINRLIERSYRPDLSADLDLLNAPLAPVSTTVPLRFGLRVPVAANDGADFMLGLINLQSQNLLMQLTIQWAAFTDLFTANAPTLAATAPVMDVAALSYAAPDPTQSQLPPVAVHRWIQNVYSINNTGDTLVRINREGLLLRMIVLIDINGAADPGSQTSGLQELRIHLNDIDNPYKITRQQFKHMHLRRYGFDMPTGTYVWDLWHANKLVGAGDQRDFLDSEAFTTLEVVPNIAGGTTLGVGNNTITVIREILQFPRRVQ